MKIKTEKVIMQLLHNGMFSVDKNNNIWQHKKIYKDKYGRKSYENITPIRAEVVLTNGHSAIRVNYDRKTYTCRTARFLWYYYNGDIPDEMYAINLGDKKNIDMKNIVLMNDTEIRQMIKEKKGDKFGSYFKYMNKMLDKKSNM